MELHETQIDATNQVIAWFNDPERKPFFMLSGRAGTGKTTIARHIIASLGLDSANEVAYIAPTGKAAIVLRRNGLDASTMHSLIYIPKELLTRRDFASHRPSQDIIGALTNDQAPVIEAASTAPLVGRNRKAAVPVTKQPPKEDLEFIKRAAIANQENLQLIVCDEASMLNTTHINDLLSFKIPVLFLGDHHQVPPVTGVNGLIKKPDVRLEKIFRQGEGSSIIEVASAIIDSPSHDIPVGRYGNEVLKISFKDFNNDLEKLLVKFPDQILCVTNEMRRKLNDVCRYFMNYEGTFPNVGEKLICLKNENRIGLVNGLQGTLQAIHGIYPAHGYMDADVLTEDGQLYTRLKINLGTFSPAITQNISWRILSEYTQFDFGYACTVHKAQGSQWNKVLFVQEYFRNAEYNISYTAVTRAAKKLIMVQTATYNEKQEFINTNWE